MILLFCKECKYYPATLNVYQVYQSVLNVASIIFAEAAYITSSAQNIPETS